MLNPGDFNKKITLQKRAIIVDELLQEIEEFIDFGTFWAMVKTTRSSEAVNNGNLESLKETRFILRHSKKLNELLESDKTHFSLTFKNQTYDVKSAIDDDYANRTVTIVAEVRS